MITGDEKQRYWEILHSKALYVMILLKMLQSSCGLSHPHPSPCPQSMLHIHTGIEVIFQKPQSSIFICLLNTAMKQELYKVFLHRLPCVFLCNPWQSLVPQCSSVRLTLHFLIPHPTRVLSPHLKPIHFKSLLATESGYGASNSGARETLLGEWEERNIIGMGEWRKWMKCAGEIGLLFVCFKLIF